MNIYIYIYIYIYRDILLRKLSCYGINDKELIYQKCHTMFIIVTIVNMKTYE